MKKDKYLIDQCEERMKRAAQEFIEAIKPDYPCPNYRNKNTSFTIKFNISIIISLLLIVLPALFPSSFEFMHDYLGIYLIMIIIPNLLVGMQHIFRGV